MISKLTISAAVVAGSLMLAAVPASAAPGANLGGLTGLSQESLVEKTHGWHRTCMWGLGGWHKHVRGVGRVQCTTRKCWRNRFGVKRCRWY